LFDPLAHVGHEEPSVERCRAVENLRERKAQVMVIISPQYLGSMFNSTMRG
jgi:hypothetical protein